MSKIKKSAIFIICLFTVTLIFISAMFIPQNVIRRKLNIELPATAKIVKYNYNIDGSLNAKILIQNNSVDGIKKQLNDFFKSENIVPINYINKMDINYKNSCEWWDLKNEDIEIAYSKFIVINTILLDQNTYDGFVFISKDDKGQHYLYIAY